MSYIERCEKCNEPFPHARPHPHGVRTSTMLTSILILLFGFLLGYLLSYGIRRD